MEQTPENVHHICIHKHFTVMDGEVYPYGADAIVEKLGYVVSDLVDFLVPNITRKEVQVCGEDEPRRILVRKLEDRIKRPVVGAEIQ